VKQVAGMDESRQPTEEEVRQLAEELEAWAGAGMKEPVMWQPVYRRCAVVIHSLLDELVAQRDVVAAQREALDFIEREARSLIIGGVDVDASAIRIRDKALAAVVSGTPPPEEEQ
jgi:hypothetical protein